MKTKLLFVLLFSTLYLQAQSQKELADNYLNKRGELAFTFTATTIDEVRQLSRILSFDHGQDQSNPLTIKAIANKKNFQKFLAFNLPFTVDKKLNDPKEVVMFNAKIHKKGVLGKNAAYPLAFPLTAYPTYQQYADQMAAFAADHSAIAELVDIGGTSGTSVVNPRLLFIKLSDNVSTREAEPRVMYTSSMHGDEIAGYPSMLNLIDYFITAYEDIGHSDHTRIKNLIDNSEVWINPMANPDGTFYGSSTYTSVSGSRRANANGIDLNRNYPDNVAGAHPDGEVYQTETIAFMTLAENNHFVLSSNFHGGVELVNYPFDNAYASTTASHTEDPSNLGPFYTHPDTDWFEYISVEYATQAQNDSDALGETSYMTVDEDSYIYPSPGVTHGAEWYRVYGGRQDYMNFYEQCREVTIELSNVKTPPTTNTTSNNEIIDIWNYNQEAYIKFLIQVTYGFQGVVKDAISGNPINAKITIVGRDDQTPITNSWVETELFPGTELGDYYRPINAGTYDILYEADCYAPVTLTNQTIADYETKVLADVSMVKTVDIIPSSLTASVITSTSATVEWGSTGGSSYDIQYRIDGTSDTWTPVSSNSVSLNLINLTANTTYEFQIRGVCNSANSAYSSSSTFTTALSYCSSSGDALAMGISNVLFIGETTISNIDDVNTNSGYEDFSSISSDVYLGKSYSLSVKINTSNGNNVLYTSAFVDFNRDGDFSINETFDLGSVPKNSDALTSNSPLIIPIPSDASLGRTRMRISTKKGLNPTKCESFSNGEVEDYTLNIIDTSLGIQDELLSEFSLYPNPVTNGEITLSMPNEITDFKVTISNVLGQQLFTEKVQFISRNKHIVKTQGLKTGIYFVTVSTNLGRATKKMIIQ